MRNRKDMTNKIKVRNFENEILKDKNGKAVHLGDKVSFDGVIAEVIWREDQGRFYLDFGNNNLFELVFYTWLHDDFKIVRKDV